MQDDRIYGLCECGCGQRTSISRTSNSYYGYVRGVPRRFVHGHSKRVPVDPAPGLATDHAWAAGIIDGEGCIHITSTQDKRWTDGRRGVGGKTYRQSVLTLTVGQAGFDMPPMLARLQRLYGGSISKPQQGQGRRRPSRTWCVAARKAEAVLLAVQPYLVEKDLEAQIALEFRRKGRQGGMDAPLVDHYANLLAAEKAK